MLGIEPWGWTPAARSVASVASGQPIAAVIAATSMTCGAYARILRTCFGAFCITACVPALSVATIDLFCSCVG